MEQACRWPRPTSALSRALVKLDGLRIEHDAVVLEGGGDAHDSLADVAGDEGRRSVERVTPASSSHGLETDDVAAPDQRAVGHRLESKVRTFPASRTKSGGVVGDARVLIDHAYHAQGRKPRSRAAVQALTVYSSLLRPLLFRLSADTAHDIGRLALRWRAPWRLAAGRPQHDPRLETNLGGLKLRTPVGLAPGFDKSGDLLPALTELGFGFVVVGSITPQPRKGNPHPRLHRYPDRQSVTNCMGMPNVGLAAAVELLGRPRNRSCPVIAAVAGTSPEEVIDAATAVEPLVDGVEIGLVCRHSPETFDMAELPSVSAIVDGVGRRTTKPTFVKIPPHHTPAELERTLAIVDRCIEAGIDGVSLSGTRQIEEPRLSMGVGGLAGRATTDDALRILGDVADRARGRLAIKAAGGVFDGADAWRFMAAGATAVEVYSAFIYRGPAAGGRIAHELLDELEARGPVPERQVTAGAT